MKKFSQKFAIRCTELEWRTASIEKHALEGRLMAMGYDTSELKFYPNKPYLATFYKNKSGMIGTTNTPAKENREVLEIWNADLFYALCCQLAGEAITPGEFFTYKDGKIYQCTRIDGKYFIHDYPNGTNAAFTMPTIHKSTFEELVERYSFDSSKLTGVASATIAIDRPIKEPMKISSISLGTMKEAPQKELGEVIEDFVMEEYAKSPLNIGGDFIKTGRIESVDRNTHFDLIPEIKPSFTGPMTFKEILQWFGDGNDVVVGSIKDNEIKCVPHTIEGISRDAVAMHNLDEPVAFDNVYKSKEAFLLHALTTLKKQA